MGTARSRIRVTAPSHLQHQASNQRRLECPSQSKECSLPLEYCLPPKHDPLLQRELVPSIYRMLNTFVPGSSLAYARREEVFLQLYRRPPDDNSCWKPS